MWNTLPPEVLAQVFIHLPVGDIGRAAAVCQAWSRAAEDTLVWKHRFIEDFQLDPHTAKLPKPKKNGVAVSWRSEYRRVVEHTPRFMTDELREHHHQVLHVAFSHHGRYFATCSKDGYVLVWDAGHPVRLLHYCNMSRFSWKYTQFAEFNADDSLLLVSGVHFGRHSVTGEIAVFSVSQDEFELQCRIDNKPYDIFGTWFNQDYVISGELRWLNSMLSESKLWLNKASQETSSEHIKIRQLMFRFFNGNVSFCRMLRVADFSVRPGLVRDGEPTPGNPVSGGVPAPAANADVGRLPEDRRVAVPRPSGGRRHLSSTSEPTAQQPDPAPASQQPDPAAAPQPNPAEAPQPEPSAGPQPDPAAAAQQPEPGVVCSGEELPMEMDHPWGHPRLSNDPSDRLGVADDSGDESSPKTKALLMPGNKSAAKKAPTAATKKEEKQKVRYLIFTTGSKTYTPHQIGFKRLDGFRVETRMAPGPSLRERVELRRRAEALRDELLAAGLPLPGIDWHDWDTVRDQFDDVDHVIDLHGHIIGMCLSPDQRYLYVNTRPWPDNYVISNPLEPPPIAREIDIHVFDVATKKRVGRSYRAHRAFTCNEGCFFLFVDVCDHFVASGAEDRHAYLWDRRHAVCLARYPHLDVVNAVAFNPRDPGMLVTVSDATTIKVWRSRSNCRALGLDLSTWPEPPAVCSPPPSVPRRLRARRTQPA